LDVEDEEDFGGGGGGMYVRDGDGVGFGVTLPPLLVLEDDFVGGGGR
jgi:hypothetical protein